jgi:hypothetical protein
MRRPTGTRRRRDPGGQTVAPAGRVHAGANASALNVGVPISRHPKHTRGGELRRRLLWAAFLSGPPARRRVKPDADRLAVVAFLHLGECASGVIVRGRRRAE